MRSFRVRWVLNPMTSILRRERGKTQRRRPSEGRMGVVLPQPRDTWSPQKLEGAKDSPRAFGGSMALPAP